MAIRIALRSYLHDGKKYYNRDKAMQAARAVLKRPVAEVIYEVKEIEFNEADRDNLKMTGDEWAINDRIVVT